MKYLPISFATAVGLSSAASFQLAMPAGSHGFDISHHQNNGVDSEAASTSNCGSCGNVCPTGSTCSLGARTCTSFQPPAAFPVGSQPAGVAVGDFNGDGILDIAAANVNNNSVSVLLGTGPGNFQPQATFPVGTRPGSVAVGDFNGDGYIDIVAVNQDSNSVSVLLGTGSGNFQPQATFPVGTRPGSVAVGDFNGDGHLDIVAVNQDSNSVSVLLGTGSGSFQPQATFPVGTRPADVAVGDFNGDGHLDIVATNNNGGFFDNSVSVLLGTGSGSFQPQATFPVGTRPISVAVGDFNGDGHLDIVTASLFDSEVSVLLGTGSGSFQPQATFRAGSEQVSVAVGDFNGDGHLDIVAANQNTNTVFDNSVSVLLGTGSGSFQPPAAFPVGSAPVGVAVGDFNGDGFLDIAAANSNKNSVSVLLGKLCGDSDRPGDRGPGMRKNALYSL